MINRRERARKIASSPHLYKVCCGCGSIVVLEVIHCENCKAYKFDTEEHIVVESALILGEQEQTTVTPEDLK